MNTIYYKAHKESETGKKLQQLVNLGNQIQSEILDYVKELGATEKYLMKGRAIFHTGIVGVEFLEEPDMKVWKKFPGFENYYRPRLSSKKGKEIDAKFDSFEVIEREEIGLSFGFDKFGSNPGYHEFTDSDLFGIAMDPDWNFQMPEEFTEITFTEYKNLKG